MRRTTRKALMHIGLFSTVLFLIIYFNGPQSKTKTFAWNEIRYRPSSTTVPESRGICPGLAGNSKPALIVSRVAADGDPNWLDPLSKKYHLCMYTVDAHVDKYSNNLQVPANKGHEAMAYLTFIIDNYDYVPAAGADFVHGSLETSLQAKLVPWDDRAASDAGLPKLSLLCLTERMHKWSIQVPQTLFDLSAARNSWSLGKAYYVIL